MYLFKKVWYLPKENEKKVKAFYDVGLLIVNELEKNAEFKGKKDNIKISNVIKISYGKQGRDFVNNWIKIEFGNNNEPSVAFFSDGGLLGWKGVLGGTKKMFNILKRLGNQG